MNHTESYEKRASHLEDQNSVPRNEPEPHPLFSSLLQPARASAALRARKRSLRRSGPSEDEKGAAQHSHGAPECIRPGLAYLLSLGSRSRRNSLHGFEIPAASREGGGRQIECVGSEFETIS